MSASSVDPLTTEGGDRLVKRHQAMLPRDMKDCNSFSILATMCQEASALIDAIHERMLQAREVYTDGPICGAHVSRTLHIISQLYEDLWMSRVHEFALGEARYGLENNSSLRDRPTTRRVVSTIVFRARIAYYCLSSRESQWRMMTTTALDLPDIRRGRMAYSSHPIMSYTGKELMFALDLLAFAWRDTPYTTDIERYIFLLSLRFGMFLWQSAPADEFGDHEVSLRKKIDRREGEFVASDAFRDIITARLEVFMRAVWQHRQRESASAREEFATFDVIATLSGSRRLITLPSDFNASRAGKELHKMAVRYCIEGANAMSIPDEYERLMAEWELWPGDRGVFTATQRLKTDSARNVLKLLHGKRLAREAFRRINEAGHKSMLYEAQPTQRSPYSLEAEIAGLCVIDAFFNGRYSFSWSEAFFVTGHAYTALLELGKLDCDIPRIVYITNTFDIAFGGKCLRTGDFFQSFAWWLHIVQCVHQGRIPIEFLGTSSEASQREEEVQHNRAFLARRRIEASIPSTTQPSSSMAITPRVVDISDTCVAICEKYDQSLCTMRNLWIESATATEGRLTEIGDVRLMVIE